jgi:glycosyltransferase involved in cell wall biosynthesis
VHKRTKQSILIIGPTAPPYNGMSVATELVLGATRDELETIHLDTADRRDLSNVGRIDFVNVWLAMRQAVRYLWLLCFRRPSIVYVPIAQDRLPFLRDCLFLIPARIFHRKVIVHLHGGHFGKFYQNSSRAMRIVIRYALGRAHRAVVLGKALDNVFDGIIPRDRVRVIPNGIPDNYTECSTAIPKGDRPTILSLGTLMREKGTMDLLEALPSVVKQIPDVRVIFAGEWYRSEERSKAAEIIKENGLESHTEFIGPVAPPRKFDILKRSAAFVMPTNYKYEGHPYVILEAMSAALPVISTRVACIPETVVDGETGFILEPGDNEELARKLVLLLGNEEVRKKMGCASRKRFLEFYTFDRFSDRLKSVFKELP